MSVEVELSLSRCQIRISDETAIIGCPRQRSALAMPYYCRLPLPVRLALGCLEEMTCFSLKEKLTFHHSFISLA